MDKALDFESRDWEFDPLHNLDLDLFWIFFTPLVHQDSTRILFIQTGHQLLL